MGGIAISLLSKWIEQVKKPKGKVGSIMLGLMNSAHNGLNKWAFNKIELKENAVTLDIGSGGGKTIHTLSKMINNGKLYGIDHSEQSVKESIKKNIVDVNTGKVVIRQASVSNIPFENDYFDLITAFQTHYFWPDLKNDVKEVFRVLKPKGTFMIVSELGGIHYHMKSYKTKEEMSQLLSIIGFRSVKFYENTHKKWLCMVGVK